jgi:hypothetical protein
MAHLVILIMRHAEKPGEKPDDGTEGVDASGAPDHRSLTPRGWQRAGAWVELFVPSLGLSSPLPTPSAIFASTPASKADIAAGRGGSKSRRPLETVTPLADRLGLKVDLRFAEGQEAQLAATIASLDGVVLVCWQHEDIATIANALVPRPPGVPAGWPGDRYNVVYRFDRPDAPTSWMFQQIVPVMLKGDRSTPI